MITIWGRNSSANVQKVAWLLGELEIEFHRKDVGGPFGGLDTPEYIAMNPNKLIPTLQDGDLTLWESEAILRYIGSTYGEQFYPNDSKKRAIVDQWLCWNQSSWFPAIMPAFLMIMKTPMKDRNPDQLKNAFDEVFARAEFMDNQLGKSKYIAGDALTLADFSFAAWLFRYYTLEIERPGLNSLKNYYDSLCSRKNYTEHVHVPYEFMRVPGAERP